MKAYSLYEAKTNFSSIITKIASSGECIILKYGNPVAKIVPFKNTEKKRKLGFLKNLVIFKKDWDAPLSEEELRDWGIE